MAIALVTNVSRATAGTSSAINTTGATLLVASVSGSSSDQGISDSNGNTWVALTGRYTAFNGTGSLFYVVNPTVGAGHTFTISGSFSSGCIAAFSGVTTSSPFDQQSAANQTTQPGTITPSVDNCLVVCGANFYDNGTVSINGGFTITDTVAHNGGVQWGSTLAYLIQTTAAASNPTISGVNGGDPGVSQASFKPAAGGATGQPTMRRWGGVPHMPGGRPIGAGSSGRMWGRTRGGLIVPRRLAA